LTLPTTAHTLRDKREEATLSSRTANHLITVNQLDVIATLPPGSRVVMPDIAWEEYEHLLTQLADNARLRLSYDQGRLEIRTLSPRHESFKVLFTHLIAVLTQELDLDWISFGSTTFKAAPDVRGTEPDDCFYLANAAPVAGKDSLDLATDPPPDLAIEVEVTPPSLDKLPIYKSLSVAELWRHDGSQVEFYHLTEAGYVKISNSDLFPFLPADVLPRFLHEGRFKGGNAMIRSFRKWGKQNKPQ
jgi:Uma2 family endonuclease